MLRRSALAISVAISAMLWATSGAQASTVIGQGFESGLAPWTVSGDFWHVQNHPENGSVKSPDINPNLVTLPDSGKLPSAFDGTNVAVFNDGDPSAGGTGTFCGQDFASITQDPKNGCTSSRPYDGSLVSPPFSLVGASSAIVHFHSWWEIESVNADQFDVMTVEYSTDGGATWNVAGKLNPANNPAGAHDESYSNNGLEQSPSWKEYLVDLSPAAGQTNVQIRFHFNTVDALYQGFRGWFIDQIAVNTPYDAASPSISSVDACQGGPSSSIWVVHGANFVENSTVLVDGTAVSEASIPASDRIELPAGPAGNHTIQVQSPNGASSNTLSFTAGTCLTPTSTKLSASPTSSLTNQTVTLTATVAAGSASPTGTVEFDNRGSAIAGCGSQPLSTGGTATCQTTFAAVSSPEALTATYLPASGSGLAGSTSTPPLPFKVGKDPTSTSLGVSNSSPKAGQSVTYTATVTPADPGPFIPTGSVRFLDGGTPIAGCTSQPLSGGASLTATCKSSYGNGGSHSVSATYLGDANFVGSSSPATTVNVQSNGSAGFGLSSLYLGCTGAKLALINAQRAGPRVAIRGIAVSALIGRRVKIYESLLGKTRLKGSAKIGPDGSFQLKVKPPGGGRRSFLARYFAKVGATRSKRRTLSRLRLILTAAQTSNGVVSLSGRAKPPLLPKPQKVKIVVQVSCKQKITVGSAPLKRDGRFTVRVAVPAGTGVLLYVARTQVRKNNRHKQAVTAFSLPFQVTR